MEKMRDLLDSNHDWPCQFQFKFVVLSQHLPLLKETLGEGEFTHKVSSKGKFTSVTFINEVRSAEEVIRVYQSVSHIEGLISL